MNYKNEACRYDLNYSNGRMGLPKLKQLLKANRFEKGQLIK